MEETQDDGIIDFDMIENSKTITIKVPLNELFKAVKIYKPDMTRKQFIDSNFSQGFWDVMYEGYIGRTKCISFHEYLGKVAKVILRDSHYSKPYKCYDMDSYDGMGGSGFQYCGDGIYFDMDTYACYVEPGHD